MIATISVEGLEIECIVGIYDEERQQPQLLLVDAEIDRDISAAADSDDVKDTVDYVDIARLLTDLAVERQYRLLEAFVAEGTLKILQAFDASRVKIKVLKPSAVPAASWAAVELERHGHG